MTDDNNEQGPIVVGTDGSGTAGKAVREAARLASALGVELHLVYAVDPSGGALITAAPVGAVAAWDPMSDADVSKVLTDAAAAVDTDGLEVKTHSAAGDPADVLSRVAEDVDAQMIVVGSRGMHGLQRVLGSVPNSVSHSARRTVLIVATD